MSTAIVWFRRDLRMNDNPALAAAAEADLVVPAFCFERGLWSGRHASANRNAYLRTSLEELDANLRRAGSRLHYRSGHPAVQISRLARESGAERVHVNLDHTAHSRARDRRVREALAADGIELIGHAGLSCVEIAAMETGSGGPFRVFTPFSRAWMKADRRDPVARPRSLSGPTAVDVSKLLSSADLITLPDGYRMSFCGDGFLYKMVRMLAGSAIKAAQGRLRLDDLAAYLDQPDGLPHGKAPLCAPPDGLTLEKVSY